MGSDQHPAVRGDDGDEGPFHPRTSPAGDEPEQDTDDDALDAVEEGAPSRLPKQAIREMMALVGQWGPAPHPLADKITGEHISSMLDLDRERVRNQRDSDRDQRRTHLVIFCSFCIFVLALVGMLLWAGNDDLTEKILIGLVSAVASGVGGYGLGKSQKD